MKLFHWARFDVGLDPFFNERKALRIVKGREDGTRFYKVRRTSPKSNLPTALNRY